MSLECKSDHAESERNDSANKLLQKPISTYTLQSEMSIECKPSIDVLNKNEVIEDHESLVRTAFSLSSSEAIVGEYPCYLVRLVTLPGWIYLTDERICFFAPLPGEEDAPRKSGYLTKKNPRTPLLNSRHYFVLQHNVLSWYDSAENHYEPLGSIELKTVTNVQEKTSTRKYGFKLYTPTGNHTFFADSDISRKEWMDDLQRTMFMAKNDGDMVRITLPFVKATSIIKASAFNLVEYIKVSLSDSSQLQEEDDVYYFVFFPNIDKAYNTIRDYWKQHNTENNKDDGPLLDDMTRDDDDTQVDAAKPITDVRTLMTNNDGEENSNSRFAAPLYFIRTLAQATFSTLHPDREDNTTLDTVVKEPGPHIELPSVNKTIKQVGNSTQTLSKAVYHALIPSSAVEQPKGDTDTPLTGTASHKESLTTGNTDTSNPPINTEQPNIEKAPKRTRSDSLKAIKNLTTRPLHQLASMDYLSDLKWPSGLNLYDKLATSTAEPSSSPTLQSQYIRTPSSTARKHFSMPIATSHLSQFTSSLTPTRQKKTEDLPSTPMWICTDLKQHIGTKIGLISPDDMEIDDMEEQYQEAADDQLQRYFPMLGTGETVIAVYRATLWRMLPYSGRLYFTENFACFHASILAGHQKIVLPYDHIVNVRPLKRHGYYLTYNLGVTTKDMNEEILFDFSSLRLRNSCLALLSLKSQNPLIDPLDSVEYSSDKEDLDPSLLGRTPQAAHLEEKMVKEHVAPPSKYSGPPLLTNFADSQQYLPPDHRSTKPLVVTCLTIGSRGDVQPYIALCKQLQKDGAHRCRIATHEQYRHWIENYGIEFKSIGGNPEDLMKLCVENNFLSISFIKNGSKFFYTWFDTLLETSWEACQGTDVLIESPSVMVGIHMAEKLEIPYFRSMPFPWTRTTKFPHPFAASNLSGGPIYNDMTYVLIDMAMWLGTSKPINRFRRDKLRLAPTSLERLELSRVPHIYSFSSLVQPIPKDWPDYIHCTGYWFLDDHKTNTAKRNWKPSPELLSFLQIDKQNGSLDNSNNSNNSKKDKRPVIYIGFGSIIVSDPDAMSRVIVEAVMEAGVRAIVCKGWSSRNQDSGQQAEETYRSMQVLHEHPDSILSLDSVPHDWLFPLIQGVVHHGGAGTCAAGLRAGLPTVIKPFFGDQKFWAQRVADLGVGVCMPKLTRLKLKDHLLTITQDEAMINKAKLLGEAIRQENGTKAAVECLYRDMELARRVPLESSATLEEKEDAIDNNTNNSSNSNRTSLHANVARLKRMAQIGTDIFITGGGGES